MAPGTRQPPWNSLLPRWPLDACVQHCLILRHASTWQVPLLSVLENMAYFKDPRGEVHHPFGKTQLETIRQYSQVPADAAFRLPIEEAVTNACDDGVPVVLSRRARCRR